MPQFTITISQAALDKLKAEVDRYNNDNGATLTVLQWTTLHLKEVAIARELSSAVAAIQHQQQEDANAALQAAVITARDSLLQSL